MTGAQALQARRLLDLRRHKLTRLSGIPEGAIEKFEKGGVMVRGRLPAHDAAYRIRRLRAALEAAGVEFIEQNGGGPGVRLRNKATPG